MNAIARLVGALGDETQSGLATKNSPTNLRRISMRPRKRSKVDTPSSASPVSHTELARRIQVVECDCQDCQCI